MFQQLAHATSTRRITPKIKAFLDSRPVEGASRCSRTEASRAFKAAAPYLGLSATARSMLDYLVACTTETVWADGHPWCWPSNEKLERHFNLSLSQIKNLTRNL